MGADLRRRRRPRDPSPSAFPDALFISKMVCLGFFSIACMAFTLVTKRSIANGADRWLTALSISAFSKLGIHSVRKLQVLISGDGAT